MCLLFGKGDDGYTCCHNVVVGQYEVGSMKCVESPDVVVDLLISHVQGWLYFYVCRVPRCSGW